MQGVVTKTKGFFGAEKTEISSPNSNAPLSNMSVYESSIQQKEEFPSKSKEDLPIYDELNK